MLPAGQATGAPGRNPPTREATRRAVATVQARPDGWTAASEVAGAPESAARTRAEPVLRGTRAIAGWPDSVERAIGTLRRQEGRPGRSRSEATPIAVPAQGEAAPVRVPRRSPEAELPPVPQDGWEWLDDERGIAVPTLDPALTGGDETVREDWRAAVPGAGRGYAVHLLTGMIAAPVEDGDVIRYAVHEITDGWHHDGDDLVHRLTRAVLRGEAGAVIGMAGQDRWRGLFGEEEIQRQH